MKIFIIAVVLPLLLIWAYFGTAFFQAFVFAVGDCFKKLFSKKNGDTAVFNLYGVYIFAGRVGCGKTISMVNRARAIKKQFPKVKIYANFQTDIADYQIESWEDIIKAENIDENGVNQGCLFLFDEIHLTFDSQGWRNAPDNLLEYISLQRHFHKCIFGASQVWSRVNKIIKEQTDFVVECKSYLGSRLILNKCFTNENYQINGTQKDKGVRKRPCEWKSSFCATDKLRGLYDTDEVIKGLSITPVTAEEKMNSRLLRALQASETA